MIDRCRAAPDGHIPSGSSPAEHGFAAVAASGSRARHRDAEPEDAMNERDDIDRRFETETESESENETALEHPRRCGCVECDPDFYFDPAERDAAPDERCAA